MLHMCLPQDVDQARQAAIEQLCSVAAITQVPLDVKLDVLKFLTLHAFFAVDKAAAGKVPTIFAHLNVQLTSCV